MEKVTVVTLTRERPTLVRRAIESVQVQDYSGLIEHLIVIDDCAKTAEKLAETRGQPNRQVKVCFKSRPPGETPGDSLRLELVYPRLSRLLNSAVCLSNSRWIAFLDDDNEYEVNHISSLVSCSVRHDCSAVHSHRKIYEADGSPYLKRCFPWAPDPQEGERIYELLCSRGVWLRGTNILKDRAGPMGLMPFRNSTILTSWDPVFLVDTSVWLLERSLLVKYPIPETFSNEDLENDTAPDDKLLELLLKNNVPIVTTGLPTVRYYLGGISNPAGAHAPSTD